jgi:hypothetical protein
LKDTATVHAAACLTTVLHAAATTSVLGDTRVGVCWEFWELGHRLECAEGKSVDVAIQVYSQINKIWRAPAMREFLMEGYVIFQTKLLTMMSTPAAQALKQRVCGPALLEWDALVTHIKNKFPGGTLLVDDFAVYNHDLSQSAVNLAAHMHALGYPKAAWQSDAVAKIAVMLQTCASLQKARTPVDPSKAICDEERRLFTEVTRNN